jgi:hypothetical protein
VIGIVAQAARAPDAADLADERRAVLEREVVAGWQPFIEDRALVVRQPVTLATAIRGSRI